MVKKIVSVVITLAMVASICCVSVGATDLTNDNKSTGYVTEIKGNTGNNTWGSGTWYRYHTGDSGTTRTSVTMELNSGQSAGSGTQLINAHQTSAAGEGKYAHASFKFQASKSFQIRLRYSGGNYQYVNFGSDGSISANASAQRVHNTGATWTVAPNPGGKVAAYNNASIQSYYNYIDIIKNMKTHTAYIYVNNVLATYSTDANVGTDWRGYLIYTSSSWSEFDYFIWRVGESTSYHFTIYDDTAEHTVTIEDILLDKKIGVSSDDSHFIFSNNDVKDYVRSANSATLSYPSASTMTVEGDYYNESAGYANAFMYMFSNGDAYQNESELGGDLLYISYDQQINNASRIEIRCRTKGDNNNGNRFTFTPDEGKIRVSSFSNTGKTLDKTWDSGSTVKVGIVIDRSGQKAYTFIDGRQLGDAFNFPGDFNDLRLYLNGTADDSVASVTYSNWLLKQYDSTKQRNELFAEIEGRPVYFTDSDNSVSTASGITLDITAQKRFDTAASVVTDAKLLVAAYDGDGNLVNFAKRDYDDGTTISDVAFEETGAESTIKVFCFSPANAALAKAREYNLD